MRTLGNILWFLLGGIWLGLSWFLLGVLLCITVIGIPFGVQCFKAAKLTVAPFGKQVRIQFEEHPIANLLWAVLLGWELALGYLICGVICCITVIGIPFGLQAFKMMKLAFLPFGADIIKIKEKNN